MKQMIKTGLLFCVMLLCMEQGRAQAAHKESTASAQVRVLDTAFYMPQLQRHRRVWIYLPKNYYQSKERFPVMYLHDGQNIFDAATSFAGEWGVDEAMDSMGNNLPQCVIVAIDNGGDKRLSEYSPYDFTLGEGDKKMSVKAEGDAYAAFLLKTLRPYVRKHFRVSRRDKHQFIAGSSMGGLISLYAVMRNPGKWGGAGVFSPAFWVVKQPLVAALEKKGKSIRCPIYLHAGQQEGTEMVPDMLQVSQLLDRVSKAKITTVIRANEGHNEAAWRREFPLFYQWLTHHF
ncbi:alpha/beta hydrolase [Pseudocnuella soli]|uniref:alpha/beta hydrolase n=1 Tax=Pseudocnuella soli TaxID=2502779 RepID=UPI00104DAA13|nr:alpha/beta hydrolase-fold protein [Pseudocnuella soli]